MCLAAFWPGLIQNFWQGKRWILKWAGNPTPTITKAANAGERAFAQCACRQAQHRPHADRSREFARTNQLAICAVLNGRRQRLVPSRITVDSKGNCNCCTGVSNIQF
jgi:hypothetical protein